MRKRLLIFLLLIIFLAGCGVLPDKTTPTPTTVKILPDPEVFTTSTPDAEVAAISYLDAWKAEDYETMYGLLTSSSQAAHTLEQFIERYENVANEAALSKIDYQIQSIDKATNTASITLVTTLESAVIGPIVRSPVMKLELENGQWLVNWDDTLILPELAGGNYLSMDRETPQRAAIYDRLGNPLAAQADAVAIGVWPDYVDLTDAKGLLQLLSSLSGIRADTIQAMIENAEPGQYLAMGEIPADQDPQRVEMLSRWGPAVVAEYTSRLYYGNGIAPHVIGYVSSIQKEEIAEYRRKGFRSDEKVGRKGLELWGDEILGGVRGGTLYVFSPEGKPIQELGSSPSQPGKNIHTTLDRDLQAGVQKALSAFSGAIVVLERDTGRVLAMASTPGFDQNAFQTENNNWVSLIDKILNDPNNPQFNRAAQGQYPLGSVFKLVTMASALQSNRYTAQTNYDCQYTFEELEGFVRYDWTWDHYQEDGVTQPSGLLTLQQGLIRSCNPFFWHIGLDLYNVGLTTTISDMSKGFGLGSKTGIVGIDEETGNIPEPQSQVDAINLAIGQGDMQVTPLQVAAFVAAIGNGGILYRPQLIEGIFGEGETFTSTFKAQTNGLLPVSHDNLTIIHEAMVGVTNSERPQGTAYRTFIDLGISVAGKTGTATSAVGDPHAWFAGYTFENREGKPDISVVVIAENAGEGAEFAAPIFRRVIELYFYGKPLKLYRWEATFDVTRSPTPLVTWTPTAQPGLNP